MKPIYATLSTHTNSEKNSGYNLKILNFIGHWLPRNWYPVTKFVYRYEQVLFTHNFQYV